MKFDPGKLMQGVQKAEKSGDAAGAAKSLLQGVVKDAVKDAVAGKVPEQMLDALRKLIAEAKKLLAASGNNPALKACIDKAEKLLNSNEQSIELVTKVTAELTELLKDAGKKQPAAATKATPDAPKAASTPKAPAAAPKAAQAAPAKKIQFTDVKEGAYYYDAVQWAVQKGIVSGISETTFSPDQNCTRAQTILLIWRAEGSPAAKSKKIPFSDVKENAYYADAVAWAAERGLISGNEFNPEGAITRAQLVTLLYRNAGSPAVSGSSTFADVPANAYYAKAVIWAANKKIASGTDANTFSPDGVCTRGQIVTFLYRDKK